MAILDIKKIEKENIIIENLIHDSSNILKTSYNYDTKQLTVTFKNGGVYYYNALPHSIYEEFKNSKSSGVYLNSSIKNKYTAVKKGAIDTVMVNELLAEVTKYKTDVKD